MNRERKKVSVSKCNRKIEKAVKMNEDNLNDARKRTTGQRNLRAARKMLESRKEKQILHIGCDRF